MFKMEEQKDNCIFFSLFERDLVYFFEVFPMFAVTIFTI